MGYFREGSEILAVNKEDCADYTVYHFIAMDSEKEGRDGKEIICRDTDGRLLKFHEEWWMYVTEDDDIVYGFSCVPWTEKEVCDYLGSRGYCRVAEIIKKLSYKDFDERERDGLIQLRDHHLRNLLELEKKTDNKFLLKSWRELMTRHLTAE